MESNFNAMWNTSEKDNVSKQIYDVFVSEDTKIQRFYADFDILKDGKLEMSVSKFTQAILSNFVKNMPEKETITVTWEYNH